MKKTFTLALCFLMIVPVFAKKKTAPEKAASGVIERTLGYLPKNIDVTVTSITADGKEYFSSEVRDSKLYLEGSSTIAVCRAFYDYVKSNNYGMFTWSVNTITLPEKLADCGKKLVVTPFIHRQYMNVCTLGYTMPYWKWDQWQRSSTGWHFTA